MANLTFKKNTIEKFSVKGILDAEAKTVEVETKDSFFTITLQDYLDRFASLPVSITIQTQNEEELDLEDTVDEAEINSDYE